jgi:hypothetical protein
MEEALDLVFRQHDPGRHRFTAQRENSRISLTVAVCT